MALLILIQFFKFYWFAKKIRKHLFRDYQERVEFLHNFDEMMNIQLSPEKACGIFKTSTVSQGHDARIVWILF